MADIGVLEKIRWYRETYGLRPLIVRGVEVLLRVKPFHQAASRAALGGGYTSTHSRVADGGAVGVSAHDRNENARSVSEIVAARFFQNQPLQVFSAPGPQRRLNLVTDSVSKGSLFGGVGTAILLAVELAKAEGAELRVVTRTEAADENGFAQVLKCNGVTFQGNIEFSYIPFNGSDQLDICDGDRFLTTSWWTTESVLGSIEPDRVDYLLQEDERMFYPLGDDWVRCQEVLNRKDIRFAVNTKLLFDHLVNNGLSHLQESGTWFEPAFFHREDGALIDTANSIPDDALPQKRRLFFYARPNNVRNLYFRGLEALKAAVSQGVIDQEKWEIVFVGKDSERVSIADVPVTLLPTMGWKGYREFIHTVDLALCLMCTPHPSYPPLDIAAIGGVVVTNKFASKRNLDAYSKNILLAELEVQNLVDCLKEAIFLVEDNERRMRNMAENRMNTSWPTALASVVNCWSMQADLPAERGFA